MRDKMDEPHELQDALTRPIDFFNSLFSEIRPLVIDCCAPKVIQCLRHAEQLAMERKPKGAGDEREQRQKTALLAQLNEDDIKPVLEAVCSLAEEEGAGVLPGLSGTQRAGRPVVTTRSFGRLSG